MTTQKYMFNTADDGEHARLLGQAQLWDRLTFRRLEGLGVGEGSRCLEVGGGTGTVVRWLADRVGPTGGVVATDLEPKWLRTVEASNVETFEHDISTEPLSSEAYDVINLRLVLMHQADEQAVLRKLIDALVPGGRLLVEEYDMRSLPVCHPPDDTWHTVAGASVELVNAAGADVRLGVKLQGMLEGAGLLDVDAEAVAFPRRVPDIQAWRQQFVEVGPRLVQGGWVTAEQVDSVIARFDDPNCDLVVYGPTLVSVTGRKPE
ncbi:class I SAM-dependent methyltransferase [Saccharopolyspora dendranthemae]|nr:methyltransferase domain-containing protein [Saccharopolyspora dendranthemae]